MIRTLFSLFLLCHLVGDYYFQPEILAESKRKSYRAVLLHCLLYSVPFLLCFLFIHHDTQLLLALLLLSFFHFLIDTGKCIVQKTMYNNDSILYFIDQSAHLISLLAVAIVLSLREESYPVNQYFTHLLQPFGINPVLVPAWATCILVLGKPANTTIKYIVSRIRMHREENSNKAGALIGTLERLIMLLLLHLGQYSAIALVLTAKSIARYELLKDKDFAEYYLLGTLASIFITLLVYILLLS